MSSQESLPERPAEGAGTSEGGEKLSKNALKKLEKEKAKAEKALQRQEVARKAEAEAEANNVSKDSYGELPIVGSKDYKPLGRKRHRLNQVGESEDGVEIAVRCRITNSRSQSAKLAFLNLRNKLESIQAVVAVSDSLSRQMVKFVATVPVESIVDVIGIVKVTKPWIVSKVIPQLPIQIDDAKQALPNETLGAEEQQVENGRPLISLSKRLDNRVLGLRSTLSRAIFEIRDGVH
ncbi:MAG: hypothetical protein M1834_007436 [Cirrosporium novae-zelandiae]|nr:MAG: hypothetical protein M1834_007436 [Cirrosporium novae-zelandiae]